MNAYRYYKGISLTLLEAHSTPWWNVFRILKWYLIIKPRRDKGRLLREVKVFTPEWLETINGSLELESSTEYSETIKIKSESFSEALARPEPEPLKPISE